MSDAWQSSDTSGELVPALCAHLLQKGNLDLILQLFINGQYNLRLEAGEVLECCLSNGACSYLIQAGYGKDLVDAIVTESGNKDDSYRRLSVSLLETLFRHGAETCRTTVENGGLDYLIEICKSRADVSLDFI